MTEKLYAIVCNNLDPDFNPLALRDAFKTTTAVSHWWNHIPNCFLVSSALTADQLTDWLRKRTGDLGFLVIETNPVNAEGHLPERSWEWIMNREHELTADH